MDNKQSGSVLGDTGAMFWHPTEDIAVAIVANAGNYIEACNV